MAPVPGKESARGAALAHERPKLAGVIAPGEVRGQGGKTAGHLRGRQLNEDVIIRWETRGWGWDWAWCKE
jgi:hypothetical protein